MSWLDDIIDTGSSVLKWFGSSGVGPTLAKTALLGYTLNRVTKSINKSNDAVRPIDQGTRIQLDPSTENKIPVVYGTAFTKGIITDAVLSADNKTLFVCLTISEKTGNVNLGAGAASTFTFKKIFWNEQQLSFQSDGITVASSTDRSGTVDTNQNGLIKVYCFDGNSDSPSQILGTVNTNTLPAYSIFPNWTSNHDMSDLVFAIVSIQYDKEKSVTNIGNFTFQVENSMNQPGDVIYDYMTNTRYGAGIDPAEIYSS